MPCLDLDYWSFMSITTPQVPRRVRYQDRQTPGLILEVRESGAKTFAFRYRDENGIQRQHKIGRYPRVGISLARREAGRLSENINWGIFPTQPLIDRSLPRRVQDMINMACLEIADAQGLTAGFVQINAS